MHQFIFKDLIDLSSLFCDIKIFFTLQMLDENVRLIHSLMTHQRVGALKEAAELERVLHRNLIYLATIADRTTSQPVSNSQTTSNLQIPSGTVQNNQNPVFVGGVPLNLPPNAIPNQVMTNSAHRYFEHYNTEVVPSETNPGYNHIYVTNSQQVINPSCTSISNSIVHPNLSSQQSEIISNTPDVTLVKSNGNCYIYFINFLNVCLNLDFRFIWT